MIAKIQIKKAREKGRDRLGNTIYPKDSWIILIDGKYHGWNWDFNKVKEYVRDTFPYTEKEKL